MTGILFILFLFATAVLLYFVAYCFVRGQKPIPRSRETSKRRRFAILIPARNEEHVIGNLIDSLMRQEYPRDRYKVYVVVNNSTDRTAEIAEAAGARILRPDCPVSSKGDALRFAFSALSERKDIDAFVIFDADNVVDKDFLSEMNRQYEAGANIVQGRRSGKNASQNLLTGCYEVFYLIQNVYYNHALSNAGESCALNGTGWMIRREWLAEHGFPIVTMTEDLELTALAVAGSGRVVYAHDAVTYDEYPTTIRMAARQLSRWCFGQAECMRGYAHRLFGSFFKRGSLSGFCMGIVFTASFTVPLYGLLLIWAVWQLVRAGILPNLGIWYFVILLFAVWIILMPNVYLAYKKRGEEPQVSPAVVLVFPFFMLSWLPLAIGGLFRKNMEWKPVVHDRSITIEDRERDAEGKKPKRHDFFAVYGECEPAGLHSAGHRLLLVSALVAVAVALNHTLLLPFGQIRTLIRVTSVLMWVLELVKIGFKLFREKNGDPTTWVPLYFCSGALYASLLSGFGSGLWQRAGDVFLMTGGLCAGVCFLVYPSSSLLLYPTWHYCSLHSFFYHGWMVWLGILVSRSGYAVLDISDFPSYFVFCLVLGLAAWLINRKTDSNLMFLNRSFPGTFLEGAYRRLGRMYAPIVMLVQIFAPFFFILALGRFLGLDRPDWYPPLPAPDPSGM